MKTRSGMGGKVKSTRPSRSKNLSKKQGQRTEPISMSVSDGGGWQHLPMTKQGKGLDAVRAQSR